jgi:Sulfotransferase family
MISHKKRFIFVHIYKTGGTSVTHALIQHARVSEQLAVRYPPTRAFVNCVNLVFGLADEGNRWLTGAHKHSTAAEFRTLLGPDVYDQYFTFAFVRNPWSWQCSQYYYIRASTNHRDHKLACRLSFKEFLRHQVENKTRCQLDFLTDTDGNEIVDKIGRYESIQKDFDEIETT